MGIDRWLAVIGILLGVPSFFKLFWESPPWAAVGAIAALLFLGSACYVWYLTHRPRYYLKKLALVLDLQDPNGAVATIDKLYELVPCYSQMRDIEFRNIAATGEIDNFRWDGIPLPPGNIRKDIADYSIKVDFGQSLPPNQPIRGKLTYDLKDTFLEQREWLDFVCEFPTTVAQLRVRFPKDRPPKSYAAELRFGGVDKALDPPHLRCAESRVAV